MVFRKGAEGREVLLVHRPKYDDWSFPKGKLDPGEHVSTAAAREVREETGLQIRLGLALLPQIYPISGGAEKKVHYWRGYVLGDDDVNGYPANTEIDQVTWIPVGKAATRLSYPHDVALLDEASSKKRTRTLVVVRHGQAQDRKSWTGADPERPLKKRGREQARALEPVLRAYGISRVISSPSTRCLETVAPYAKACEIPVETWPGLCEEEFENIGVQRTASRLLALKQPAVACTHRPVLPGLLHHLGVSEEPLAPGELVVIQHRRGRVVGTERHLVR